MKKIPLFDYERDRIIMETSFVYKGQEYLFFPEGVDFYSLYRSERKVNSLQEIEYIGEKFIWLNKDFDFKLFCSHMIEMTDRSNGHVIRTYSKEKIITACESAYNGILSGKIPYCARRRKVIFNPVKMIEKSEKIKIVNSLLHPRKVFEEKDIWDAVDVIEGKITMKSLGEQLNCSPPTVRKSINDSMLLKIKEINEKRKKIRHQNLILSAIKSITDEGAKVTVREVKRRVPVRDQDLLRWIAYHES
jgi:hypothetical protein